MFRIYTGWILIPTPFDLDEQVKRLEPYLGRRNFETAAARRRYREAFPDTEKLRLRDLGPDTVREID